VPSPADITRSPVRRRDVLVGSVALLALTATAAACQSTEPPPVEVLEPLLSAATTDSEQANRAATVATGTLAAVLTQIAAERGAHADALATEIARVAGATVSSSTSATTTTVTAGPPPAPRDVLGALQRSADTAAALVPSLSGYRAGLVGSIAASCTASATVALASVQAGS